LEPGSACQGQGAEPRTGAIEACPCLRSRGRASPLTPVLRARCRPATATIGPIWHAEWDIWSLFGLLQAAAAGDVRGGSKRQRSASMPLRSGSGASDTSNARAGETDLHHDHAPHSSCSMGSAWRRGIPLRNQPLPLATSDVHYVDVIGCPSQPYA
jgi:hypothetical protein